MAAGGGKFSAGCAVVVAETETIVIPAGGALKLYSALTQRCICRLLGHTRHITGLAVHPTRSQQVFTASLDGTIRLWDVVEGTLLQTVGVGTAVHSLVAPQEQKYLYFEQAHADADEKADKAVVRLYNVESHQLENMSYPLSSALSDLTASAEGHYVGAAHDKKLLVWSTEHGLRTPFKILHTRRITCAAIDARASRIAAGDVSGRVHVWHGLRTALAEFGARHPTQPLGCTVLHWHARPPACLAFTPDSAYLLSGGEEAVLVMWDLTSGAKRFLPRLAGRLRSLSTSVADPGRVLTTLEDSDVRVLNMATMQVDVSIRGLADQASQDPSHCRATAVLAPGTGALVTARQNGELQLYDVLNDRHLSSVPVAVRNVYHKGHPDVANSAEALIRAVSVSADGECLATVDVRPDISGEEMPSLRIWRRADDASVPDGPPFELQTVIERPHSGVVMGLAWHPKQRLLASIATDDQLRTWAPSGKPSRAAAAQGWHCRSKTAFRERALRCIDINSDGSVIALGSNVGVILWDSRKQTELGFLQSPIVKPPSLWAVAAVPQTPFIVGVGVEMVVCWDLLAAAVAWWLPVKATSVAADPSGSGHIAIGMPPSADGAGTSAACVALLHATDPEPKQVWLLPGGTANTLHFVPRGTALHEASRHLNVDGADPLLILTEQRSYVVARPHGAEPTLAAAQREADQSPAASPMDFLRAPSATHGAGGVPSGTQDSSKARAALTQHAETPTHWLAPMSRLSAAFCEELLCSEHSVTVP